MTDRRSFFCAVSAAGAWLARPGRLAGVDSALNVDASPTVFFAHPDGSRNLVRFAVTGVDAPAGRLRVFDRSRQLLGTAGLLRTGDLLYGELWMELEDITTAVSELEAPGVRGPFRTTHRLVPGRRWTIHLITVADPDDVSGALTALRPIHRAIQTAIYRDSAVTLNPLSVSALSRQEHLPFLRMAERALAVERQHAIPLGTAAYVPPNAHLPKTGALALRGAGVSVLLREQQEEEPFEWWGLPGGSRILVISVPEGSNPRALGFDLTQSEMTGRVEEWLSSTALRFSPDENSGTAVVLNSSADEGLPAALETVSAWNSRFAYPRVVVGNSGELFEELGAHGPPAESVAPVSLYSPKQVFGTERVSLARARMMFVEQRLHEMGEVLGNAVAPGASDLETVAAYVSTAVPGTLVLNSSPYQHSDLVRMSDGSERLATNVPGIGYAFFPDESVIGDTSAWAPIGETFALTGQQLRVTIDRMSGAISSMVQRSDGREWVRPGSAGINAVEGARLVRATVDRLDGVATRMSVSRRAPRLGAMTTTVTVYDELPWLTVENELTESVSDDVQCQFHLATSQPEVSWEIPAGYEGAPAPVPLLEHVRWICVKDGEAGLMLRGFDAALASVDAEGTLVSHAPGGRSRYRIQALPRYASQDTPWVFGWNSDLLGVARVEPNGTDALPRFGSLLRFETVGITVLGLNPAAAGYGAVVYLQETLGVSRTVSIAPEVLRFRNADTVDFLERYLEQLTLDADGSVRVPIQANSVVAVRLSGLEVS